MGQDAIAPKMLTHRVLPYDEDGRAESTFGVDFFWGWGGAALNVRRIDQRFRVLALPVL